MGGLIITSTEVYKDYLSPYYPFEYNGTYLSIDDLISSVFRWDPPTAIPMMYVQKPMSPVIEPYIEARFNRFQGNKFSIGGSKK